MRRALRVQGVVFILVLVGYLAEAARPARSSRAYLFTQCDHDLTVNKHHAADLKAASANNATELWLVPECGHMRPS